MAPPGTHQIVATLARQVSQGADAVRIADHVVAVWQRIDEALTPIIGSQGVAALYGRSLYLVAPAHPWLAGLRQDPPSVDAAALRSVLAEQDAAAAAAGGGALLRTFDELLASLVGNSLTGRLLAAAWEFSTGGPSAQGTSP